jgi:hemolysin-activating ACP:hemolysin acyltransferase
LTGAIGSKINALTASIGHRGSVGTSRDPGSTCGLWQQAEQCGVAEKFGLKTRMFENRATALGLAVEYLMNKPAFARIPFGHWSRVLTGQIRRGHYFFVCTDRKVVGFAGWALGSKAEAEAWISGNTADPPGQGLAGDNIILNAWAADTTEANKILLEELRIRGRDNAMLYARREYPDGRARPLRLKLGAAVVSHAAKAERTSGRTG